MPTEDLTQLVERMSNQDFIVALILTKKGTPLFKEEALRYSLRELSNEYDRLNTLFPPRSVSAESANSFENIIGLWTKKTANDEYRFIHPALKSSLRAKVNDLYGKDVLDRIKPLSERVWKCAEDYR
jgi:Zn-dependent M32 family carboxypeptidase